MGFGFGLELGFPGLWRSRGASFVAWMRLRSRLGESVSGWGLEVPGGFFPVGVTSEATEPAD